MSGLGGYGPRSINRILEDLTSILLAEHHQTHLFPDDTNLTCLLTAGEAANTWSGWTEIVDSAETKLTSKFASAAGYLTSMVVEELSEIDTIYMLQIAYGEDKIEITCLRTAGKTKFQNPAHQERFRAVQIPAGEKVYYRLKTGTAVADTTLVHFRYFLVP